MVADGFLLPGTAVTLVTPTEAAFAADLAASFVRGGHPVTPELLQLARSSGRYRGGGGAAGAAEARAGAGGGGTSADGSWRGRAGPASQGEGGRNAGGWDASARAPGLGSLGAHTGPAVSAAAAAPLSAPTSSSAPPGATGGGGALGGRFTRAVTSGTNFSVAAPAPLEVNDDAPAGAGGSHPRYRPPTPEPLGGDAAPGAAPRVLSAAELFAGRVQADVARAAAAVRAAAGGDGAPPPTAAALLAAEDGDDVGGVDVEGGDDGERLRLLRTRGSRFGGSAPTPAAAVTPDNAVGGGRDAALAELLSVARARAVAGFSTAFVRPTDSGGEGPGPVAASPVPFSADIAGGEEIGRSVGTAADGATAEGRKRSRWGPPTAAAVALAPGLPPGAGGSAAHPAGPLRPPPPAAGAVAGRRALYQPGVRY